jgi:pyruvate dehydrogenase E2 component (dihydrolipoamide acetyltransferase)
MPNVLLQKKSDLSSFRKIALGTWKTAKDPQVYGSVTLRMDEALRYVEVFRERTGKKLTITHMMAAAVGHTLADMRDANAILRWGQIYLRKDIGVFFQVAMEDPDTGEIDLSGVTVREPETKSLEEICDEFTDRARKVREKKDKELENTHSTFKAMPQWMVRWMLDLVSIVSYTLNWNMKWAGIPQDAFGSAMVTNIGSLGLEEAYVPLVPYSRVPLLLAMGAVQDSPIVEDGEVKVGKTMRVFATFDHRVLDGSHAAKMVKTLKRFIHDPFEAFGEPSAGKALPPAGDGEDSVPVADAESSTSAESERASE